MMNNITHHSASVHCHSTYCDGKNTLAEMAVAAAAQGLSTLGFSGHSFTPEHECCGMTATDFAQYTAEVRALQAQWSGKLDILYGIEWDYYSDAQPTLWANENLPPVRPLAHAPVCLAGQPFDYWIGSVHCLPGSQAGVYHTIDWKAEIVQECIQDAYEGDALSMVEGYFATVEKMAAQRPTILGHFDLIKKLNADGHLFDESAPRYQAAAMAALQTAKQYDCVLELNTGGVYRGYRTDFYPGDDMLRAWYEMGGKIAITADAHNEDGLLFAYDKAAQVAKRAGFTNVEVLTKQGFVTCPL